MPIAAIYARYSTDEQRATSIEDQVRRCREIAAKHGYEVAEEHVFSDAAVSGSASAIDKRADYARLVAAWDANRFDAIIVDEVSRLARDVLELAKLQLKIANSGVRLLSADGLDSSNSDWQLLFGIKGAIGHHFLEETRHRVIRGMYGQLTRGFMIAYPAFGYQLERVYGDKGELLGTRWRINEKEAEVVRDIFAMRYEGRTYGAIAAGLNRRGVPLRRKRRNNRVGGFWRPSRIFNLVQNPTYRGVFVWNGSAFKRAKAKRENREVTTKQFLRPELRIVTDEVWFACNARQRDRPLRGGGRHPLAGLVTCGRCGATLAVSVQKTQTKTKGTRKDEKSDPTERGRITALHCAQCEKAHRVEALKESPPYVSASGVEVLLRHVLEHVLTGEVIVEFRRRLKAFLSGDPNAQLAKLVAEVQQANRACERLVRILGELGSDDIDVEREYYSARARRERLSGKLKSLQSASRRGNRDAAIKAQLKADPRKLLPKLFAPGARAEEARAVLRRLFPSIILLGKDSRYVSLYEVTVVPGAVQAEVTNSELIEEAPTTLRFRVSTSARRPVVWKVEELPTEQRKVA